MHKVEMAVSNIAEIGKLGYGYPTVPSTGSARASLERTVRSICDEMAHVS